MAYIVSMNCNAINHGRYSMALLQGFAGKTVNFSVFRMSVTSSAKKLVFGLCQTCGFEQRCLIQSKRRAPTATTNPMKFQAAS